MLLRFKLGQVAFYGTLVKVYGLAVRCSKLALLRLGDNYRADCNGDISRVWQRKVRLGIGL